MIVGGVDTSWDGDHGVAALVVLELPSLSVVYESVQWTHAPCAYEAGRLGEREVPAHLRLILDARARGLEADVVLVDGFGVLHPRGYGSATRLGVEAGVPTIGVGKSLLKSGCDSTEHAVRTEMDAGRLASLDLAQDGRVVGRAIRSPGHTRPVYVSVGHMVTLDAAVATTRACSVFRVPEPIRAADALSRRTLAQLSE